MTSTKRPAAVGVTRPRRTAASPKSRATPKHVTKPGKVAGHADLARLRLCNQFLLGQRASSAEEVVRWLGAVQAQDYAGAKWAVGQRTEACRDADVELALQEGRILRTHVMRPTWHFVAPEDIRWLLALTAPRVHAASAYQYRKLALDAVTVRRSSDAITKALEGGRQRTREELRAALAAAGIEADGLRLGYLMMHAELAALICSGGRRGKQFTYALLDERAPSSAARPREQALAELSLRYFRSHGPASARDFAWWSGLTLADANRGIASVQRELRSHELDGTIYWSGVRDRTARTPQPVLHLLPNYDEHLIAYRDRALAFDRARVPMPRAGLALNQHFVLLNGQVIGGYARTLGKQTVTIHTKLLTKLKPVERNALQLAAAGLGEFLGLRAVLE